MPIPDPVLVQDLRDMVARPKYWPAGTAIEWVDRLGDLEGKKFRLFLEVAGGAQPEGLYVAGFFKPAVRDGVRDKLSFSLVYRSTRIIGVDDNGPSRHENTVGILRPLYRHRIDHPQLHTISDDALEGYAEPLDVVAPDQLWTLFTAQANIAGAPTMLMLPPVQREIFRGP